MKATGILRRIDELGRVVIPKEIRKTMKMREGEELEIFTTEEEVVLKKYSELSSMESLSRSLVAAIHKASGHAAVVVDGDKVVAVAGKGMPAVGEPIEEGLRLLISSRRRTVLQEDRCLPFGEEKARGQVIQPIISSGDLFGALILVSLEPIVKADEQLAQMGAIFFEQQIER